MVATGFSLFGFNCFKKDFKWLYCKLYGNNYTFVPATRMKKFVAVILALLYITTSTGATLHMHYCMGELADWDFGMTKSESCGQCGMEKNGDNDNGCCKDEQAFIKNDRDQVAAPSGFHFASPASIALPVPFIEFPPVNIVSVTEANPLNHAPPRSSGTAVYVRNCVFLI